MPTDYTDHIIAHDISTANDLRILQEQFQHAAGIRKKVTTLDVFNFSNENAGTIEKYMFCFEYEAGSFVYREVTHRGYMFFIVEGEVRIIKSLDAKCHVTAELCPDRSVSEMSLIDRSPRSSSNRAKQDFYLIVLKNEVFRKLLDQQPVIVNKMLMGIATLMSNSLHDTNKVFTEKLPSIV